VIEIILSKNAFYYNFSDVPIWVFNYCVSKYWGNRVLTNCLDGAALIDSLLFEGIYIVSKK